MKTQVISTVVAGLVAVGALGAVSVANAANECCYSAWSATAEYGSGNETCNVDPSGPSYANADCYITTAYPEGRGNITSYNSSYTTQIKMRTKSTPSESWAYTTWHSPGEDDPYADVTTSKVGPYPIGDMRVGCKTYVLDASNCSNSCP